MLRIEATFIPVPFLADSNGLIIFILLVNKQANRVCTLMVEYSFHHVFQLYPWLLLSEKSVLYCHQRHHLLQPPDGLSNSQLLWHTTRMNQVGEALKKVLLLELGSCPTSLKVAFVGPKAVTNYLTDVQNKGIILIQAANSSECSSTLVRPN